MKRLYFRLTQYDEPLKRMLDGCCRRLASGSKKKRAMDAGNDSGR